MVTLMSLWLPILLSAVFVFLASSIIHMTPLWHRSDYPKMPREDEVLTALRPFSIPPGDYFIPRAGGMAEMKTPEFRAKLAQGPIVVMTVLPKGGINMTSNLVQWFIYLLVVGVFVAYLASRTLPPGTPYRHVFQIVGASAFIGYALALAQMSIWYRRSWGTTLKTGLDGLIYALLTAGTFGWLWPH